MSASAFRATGGHADAGARQRGHLAPLVLLTLIATLALQACVPEPRGEPGADPSGDPSAQSPRPSEERAELPATSAFPMQLPLVQVGACPFECCTYRSWTADSIIEVYAWERADRPRQVAFTLETGDDFEAVTGNVHVLEPAVLTVVAPYEQGLYSGDTLRMVPGDTAFVLDYLGEGFFNVWLNGRALEVEAFWSAPGTMTGDSTVMPGRSDRDFPVTEWWVQVRTATDEEGWVHVTPDTRFHGADACA